MFCVHVLWEDEELFSPENSKYCMSRERLKRNEKGSLATHLLVCSTSSASCVSNVCRGTIFQISGICHLMISRMANLTLTTSNFT